MDRLFSPSSSFARNAHTFALGNYPFQAGFEETSNANRHFGRQIHFDPDPCRAPCPPRLPRLPPAARLLALRRHKELQASRPRLLLRRPPRGNNPMSPQSTRWNSSQKVQGVGPSRPTSESCGSYKRNPEVAWDSDST